MPGNVCLNIVGENRSLMEFVVRPLFFSFLNRPIILMPHANDWMVRATGGLQGVRPWRLRLINYQLEKCKTNACVALGISSVLAFTFFACPYLFCRPWISANDFSAKECMNWSVRRCTIWKSVLIYIYALSTFTFFNHKTEFLVVLFSLKETALFAVTNIELQKLNYFQKPYLFAKIFIYLVSEINKLQF